MAARKTSRAASKDVKRAMSKRKRGMLKSGSGKKVTSRKQAIAIGLSEARKKGKKVAKKKASWREQGVRHAGVQNISPRAGYARRSSGDSLA